MRPMVDENGETTLSDGEHVYFDLRFQADDILEEWPAQTSDKSNQNMSGAPRNRLDQRIADDDHEEPDALMRLVGEECDDESSLSTFDI